MGCDLALEVGGKGKYNPFLIPRGIMKCDVYKRCFDATGKFCKKFFITKEQICWTKKRKT